MAFTPICPQCGSAAIKRLRAAMSCQRCGHRGAPDKFTRIEDRLASPDYSADAARRSGVCLPSRTIRLSDESGD